MRHKNENRKKYLIDRKFQLGATLKLIGLYTGFIGLVIIVIAISMRSNNHQLDNIVVIEENVVNTLIDHSQPAVGDTAGQELIKKAYNNHTRNISSINQIINFNNILVYILIIFAIIQAVVIFYLLIKRTHRISGPLYVISQYMNEIIEGKIPNPRPLRDKDSLQEFYKLFNEMIKSLKKENRENK